MGERVERVFLFIEAMLDFSNDMILGNKQQDTNTDRLFAQLARCYTVLLVCMTKCVKPLRHLVRLSAT